MYGAQLWDLKVDPVAFLRPFQIIIWCILRQLVLLSPVAHRVKVSAGMDGVEIDERLDGRSRGLVPDLTQDADVNIAHQLLANDVEAVCCRPSK